MSFSGTLQAHLCFHFDSSNTFPRCCAAAIARRFVMQLTKRLSKFDPYGSSNISAGLVPVTPFKESHVRNTEDPSQADVRSSPRCSRTMKVMAASQRYIHSPLLINCTQERRWNSHLRYGNVLFLPLFHCKISMMF